MAVNMAIPWVNMLDSSQNLETTDKNKNSDDCTPEASRR
jgi:hypothetical protein